MKVICLVGPTCTGKSDLAISLAEQLPIEIISVDSAMVYQSMDIGTAKPSLAIRDQIPHHLIDIHDPSKPYSAATFCEDIEKIIPAIVHQGKIPLLIGGTMLYFKAFSQGLSPLPTANSEVRAKIIDQANKFGWNFIHQQLKDVDPESAKRIHPNDPQRLQRALEVYYLTGKPITNFYPLKTASISEQKEYKVSRELPYDIEWIGLMPDNRGLLHQVIRKRFLDMLNHGLIEEVDMLFQRKDLHENLPSIKSVGYRQIWQYLANRVSYDEMVEQAVIATRQLAKRQMTWMRNWHETIYQINSQAKDRQSLLIDRIKYIINSV